MKRQAWIEAGIVVVALWILIAIYQPPLWLGMIVGGCAGLALNINHTKRGLK